MTSGPGSGNGAFHPDDPDALDDMDDDAPLDATEEAAASLEAGAETDESLDERVEAVISELDGVERRREGESVTYDMKPHRDDPTAVGTSEVADAIIEKLKVTA